GAVVMRRTPAPLVGTGWTRTPLPFPAARSAGDVRWTVSGVVRPVAPSTGFNPSGPLVEGRAGPKVVDPVVGSAVAGVMDWGSSRDAASATSVTSVRRTGDRMCVRGMAVVYPPWPRAKQPSDTTGSGAI